MKRTLLLCTTAAATFLICSPAQAQPIADPGTEGFFVLAGSGDVIATYLGTTAAYSNDLYLQNTDQFLFNNQAGPVGSTVNLGSFMPGTELLFRLHVNNTGFDYYTGPGSRNPDNNPHARVQADWTPGTTLVSFEDLFNGPFNYNDLSFSFSNTISSPGAVPEPGTWAMLLIGFAGIGGAMRAARRKRKLSISYA